MMSHASPPVLLALDLSTAHGSIAVVNGAGDMLFEATFQSERSHNAQVFAPLRQALTAAGTALSHIVIGIGPGSYTGVRIAIAAAQGIALSRGIPCIGWSSLTAPHFPPPQDYHILGDARRQSYYLARVQNGRLQPGIETLSADAARARVQAAPQAPWLTFDAKIPLDLPCIQLARPDAAQLARNILALTEAERQHLSTTPLLPHYLAEAFITIAKKPIPRGP